MAQFSENIDTYYIMPVCLRVDLIYFFLFLMQKMFHLYYCRLIIHLLDLDLQRALFSYKTWLNTLKHTQTYTHTLFF